MTASAGPRKRWPGTGRQHCRLEVGVQEALDHMEEMVAAVIPEEIVTGIQGQDSADYQETTHMQEDDGSPADMPVQDYPDDMDDELTNISQQTLQEVLETLQTTLQSQGGAQN
ncbi:hypothetical protein NDU88_004773 [Pleurodeles waltl]|uniref:Uncharacterized protein n=1 Tax=Pleurodeles waltl TaxID=8319 RepID=A0AAV7SJR8_PLEWA|nr:hypothetical protein NDU88_004773 [Pleurodeles waltl]